MQAQPSAHIDRSPSSSASPPLYLTMATNSPVLTLLHPRLRGSEEKSITVPSGTGSEVKEVLDNCVRGRKQWKRKRERERKYLCECVLHKEWSRETEWPKPSWAQMSGLSKIKFMTIDWSCAHVCARVYVCAIGWWWMCVFLIVVESDRGEESSYKAHYSQWNKWIPWDVPLKHLSVTCPSVHLSICPDSLNSVEKTYLI